MEFKLAIFDWNGTTIDDLPVVYASVREIFRTYGVPAPTFEDFKLKILQFYKGKNQSAQ